MPLNPTDLLVVSRGGVNYKAEVSDLDDRYQTANDNLSAASLNGGHLAGLRNKIINGNFVVSQRNHTGAYSIPAGTAPWTVDRWGIFPVGSAATANIIEEASPRKNTLRIAGGAGNSTIDVFQRIESFNCSDIAGQTVTLSFETSNTTRPTITWRLIYPTANDSFTSGFVQFATGTVNITSTLTRYSVTVALPEQCSRGIQVMFQVTNQTSGTWSLANVQLELGPIATPFERRPIPIEETLCKRYFQWIPLSMIGVATGASQTIESTIVYPVSMRVLPTIGGLQVDPRPGTAPQVFQNANQGINRRTVDYACPFVQSSGAGQFFVVGYRWPLDAEIA